MFAWVGDATEEVEMAFTSEKSFAANSKTWQQTRAEYSGESSSPGFDVISHSFDVLRQNRGSHHGWSRHAPIAAKHGRDVLWKSSKSGLRLRYCCE